MILMARGIEVEREEQLVMINLTDFNAMKEELESNVNRDAAGLDDMMLKKLLLAYNMGSYSQKSTIIIELDDGSTVSGNNEVEAIKNDSSLVSPFKMVKGSEIPQFDTSGWADFKNGVANLFSKEDVQNETSYKQALQKKYFLIAHGTLIIKNEKGKELLYFNEEVLNKLYENEYLKQKDGEHRDYAESVWEYLGNCYTDGKNGITTYSHESITESITQWTFKDDGIINGPKIVRTLASTTNKTRDKQNIDLNAIIGEYTTPLEFMVNLLEISSSKDFVNSFIDKVASETSITIVVYKTGQSQSEEKRAEMKETTYIKGEIKGEVKLLKIAAKVKEGDKEVEKHFTPESWVYEGNSEIKIQCDTKDDKDGIKKVKISVTVEPVPKNVTGVLIELHKGEGNIQNVWLTAKNSDGGYYYEDNKYLCEKYVTKSNKFIGIESTITATTESKFDVAIEEVNNWYANIKFNNVLVTDRQYETIDANGNLVDVTKDVVNKTKGKKLEKYMIMNPGSKATETYTRDANNVNTIFKEDTVRNLELKQLEEQHDDWYNNLTSDNPFYWLTGGPITKTINKWIKEEGGTLHTYDDCVHVKYTYAMEQGIFDDWFRNRYTPIEIKSEYYEYKEGKLISSVNTYLKDNSTYTMTDRYDFFLSLLQNNNPSYKDADGRTIYTYKKDAEYGTGEGYGEVSYKDTSYVNDNVRVVKLILNGEDILYNLLEKSENTQGLVSVMRAILNKYKGDAGLDINDILDLEKPKDEFAIIGKTTEEKLWISLIRIGLTKEQAASVMGNVAVDCGFDENKITNTTTAEVGLCKWSGTRRIGLRNYAISKGIPENKIDVNTQIQFLIGELTEGGNSHAIYQIDSTLKIGGNEYTADSWKDEKNTDINSLTKTFAYVFKKPNNELSDIAARQQKANEYYNNFKDSEINDLIEINEKQTDIAEAAKSGDVTPQAGYCYTWVREVYEKAGIDTKKTHCALYAGYLYGVSRDFSYVPVGAAVYGQSKTSPRLGHVGIYVGNGIVMDNWGGRIRSSSLGEWLEENPDGCWGWASKEVVNEAYPITEGLIKKDNHIEI